MNGEFLYQWVLATPCDERMEAVQALNDVSLCRLADHLEKTKEGDDVLGICIIEGFDRFARQKRGQDVPATIKEDTL